MTSAGNEDAPYLVGVAVDRWPPSTLRERRTSPEVYRSRADAEQALGDEAGVPISAAG